MVPPERDRKISGFFIFMKEIVPKDSRYIPFTQQRSSCVPTCIWMIMYKQKIPLIAQELLGYHLGLTVAPEFRYLFWNARKGKKPRAGYGTRLSGREVDPNKVFSSLKIPLRMTYRPINQFPNVASFKNYISDAVKKDKDVIVCFDFGTLNDLPERDGHVSVIDRLVGKDSVRLIDPSPRFPKWRIFKLSKLKKALEVHGEKKHAGFWEFKKI
ncbi:MAG TPA: hypothetical protein VF974_00550 [Patescibacteria group bacterium]